MGTFRTDCTVENILNRKKAAKVSAALVDTGSEFSWVQGATLEKIGVKREKKDRSFTMANGQQVTRSVGFAIVRVGREFTVDEVVFAEPGDLSLLGARTLEGLSLTVDPNRKKLVAAGPLPAAGNQVV
jgi:predicted aspartyl protease